MNWKMASTYLVHRRGLREPRVEQETAKVHINSEVRTVLTNPLPNLIT